MYLLSWTDEQIDSVAGRAPSSDQALAQQAQKKQQQRDDEAAANGSGSTAPTLGHLDALVLAGVALYVATVYAFWEPFRAYFDWSESLAISLIVRGASVQYPP